VPDKDNEYQNHIEADQQKQWIFAVISTASAGRWAWWEFRPEKCVINEKG